MGWERILAGMGASMAEAGQLQATRREKMRDDMAMEMWRKRQKDEATRTLNNAKALLLRSHGQNGVNLRDRSTYTAEVKAAIASSEIDELGILEVASAAEDEKWTRETREHTTKTREEEAKDKANKAVVKDVVNLALERAKDEYGYVDRRGVDIEAIVDEVAPSTEPSIRDRIVADAKQQFRIVSDKENQALTNDANALASSRVIAAANRAPDEVPDTPDTPKAEPLPEDVQADLTQGLDRVTQQIIKADRMDVERYFNVLISSGEQSDINLRKMLTNPLVREWEEAHIAAGLEVPDWNTTSRNNFLRDVQRAMAVRIAGDKTLSDLQLPASLSGPLADIRDTQIYNRILTHLNRSIGDALRIIGGPAPESEDEVEQKPEPLSEEDIAVLSGTG